MNFIRKNRILFSGGLAMVIYFLIAFWIITYPFSTKAQSSTWTVQTLKEYTDQRFEAVIEKFEAMETAVTKAETAITERFQSVNEFRATLSDQQQTFVSKSENDALHVSLVGQMNELKLRLDKLDNLKVGQNNTIGWLVGGFGLVIAAIALGRNLISFLFKPKQ